MNLEAALELLAERLDQFLEVILRNRAGEHGIGGHGRNPQGPHHVEQRSELGLGLGLLRDQAVEQEQADVAGSDDFLGGLFILGADAELEIDVLDDGDGAGQAGDAGHGIADAGDGGRTLGLLGHGASWRRR